MTGTRRFRHLPMRVIVVGGGVAALEACLAVRAIAGERVHVSLIAQNRYLAYRPIDVRDPLDVHGDTRVPLARVAGVAGADLRHDRVVTIDPRSRWVYTAEGYEIPYDALVVAVGAVAHAVPARAQPFDPPGATGCRVLLHDLYEGRLGSLAFVEPSAPTRSFELYDLALQAAVTCRRRRVKAELTIVTAQPAPLSVLGRRAAGLLGTTIGAHGVHVVASAHVRSIGYGEVELAPLARRVTAERVIAAPRLRGPQLKHLPCDGDGFVPVDPDGRVRGAEGVYAAGDCAAFPVKHPSLAAQQADAVAASIAADAGLPVVAQPFKPVLRGMLPSRLRWYVEAPLTGGQGDATRVSALPLWPPPLRFDACFLAPALVSASDPEARDLEPSAA